MLYPSMHFHWFLFESKSFGRILKQKEVKNCWILDGIFKEFLFVVKSKSWRLNKLSIDLLKIYPCTESTSLKPFFTLEGLFALLLLLNPWSKPRSCLWLVRGFRCRCRCRMNLCSCSFMLFWSFWIYHYHDIKLKKRDRKNSTKTRDQDPLWMMEKILEWWRS